MNPLTRYWMFAAAAIVFCLWPSSTWAQQLPAPLAGEIELTGQVTAANSGNSVDMAADTLILPDRTVTKFDSARSKTIALVSYTKVIMTDGTAKEASDITVGAQIAAIGTDMGVGKSLKARAIIIQSLPSATAVPAAPVDVNARDADGFTALMRAAMQGDADGVKTLIAQGSDVNATDSSGNSALYWAASTGDLATVKAVMAGGANINSKCRDGGTLLTDAAAQGRTSSVKVLLSAGADVNGTDLVGNTPLILAARQGDLDSVTTLLAAGANVKAKDTSGCTALYRAVEGDHADCAKALIAAGADTNAAEQVGGNTPLIMAASSGYADCVAALIAGGVKVNSKNNLGETALMGAASNGHTECVVSLIAEKAELNTWDKDGYTALMKAAHHGNPNCVQALLAAGANIETKGSKDGKTALLIAKDGRTQGCVDCATLLQIAQESTQLSTFTASPAVLSGTAGATGRITLSAPPALALTISLRSSNPSLLSVPDSVIMQSGATFITFPIRVTGTATAPTLVTLTATGIAATLKTEVTIGP